MHVLDALNMGGAERVAVNLANLLPRSSYAPFLCTTRSEGPFANLIAADVGRLSLSRRNRIDTGALRRFKDFVRANKIRILHAHGSSLFFARLASLFPPYPLVVWHDHYGNYLANNRPAWLYRAATRGLAGVITVNQPLAEWSRRVLQIPANRIWYIPNLIPVAMQSSKTVDLPGSRGFRIVCVANFRPQKDHANLFEAMTLVSSRIPQAHLLLVGEATDTVYRASILDQIHSRGLDRNISYLGPRQDVPAILRACDIGVLASKSEGLPLALLEYGVCGLPAVATEVGQCADVLSHGFAGLLVPPSSPKDLAEALCSLLSSPDDRKRYGGRLQELVRARHSPESTIRRVCDVYQQVLGSVSRN